MDVAGSSIPFINIEWFLRLLFILLTFIASLGTHLMALIVSMFDGKAGVGVPSGENGFLVWLNNAWALITVISTLLSLFFGTIVVYSFLQIKKIRKAEGDLLKKALVLAEETVEGEKNSRWEHIKMLMATPNPNDWRQAIIEADIMLDEMLATQRYAGASVGDKLKQVEASDMATLQDAWEAHKVRNQIAHSGSNFLLTPESARATITRYEAVFLEFSLI